MFQPDVRSKCNVARTPTQNVVNAKREQTKLFPSTLIALFAIRVNPPPLKRIKFILTLNHCCAFAGVSK